MNEISTPNSESKTTPQLDVKSPLNTVQTTMVLSDGQALQLALFFTQTSAVPIGNPGLPFGIYVDQEAFIPRTPGR